MTRTILIPGGTGALGTGIVQHLVAEGCRCVVPYIADHEAQALRARIPEQQQDQLTLVTADMLDPNGVETAFEAARAHGGLHGLVHLIGGVRGFQSVADTTIEDWDALLALNLRTLFLTSRLAMREFASNGVGRIITIGAMAAVKPSATQHAYGVAKAGVVALTKILADEGRTIGVTANCIVPGVIVTPANLAWGTEEEHRSWTTPAQIASTVSHLLSEQASAVNGSVLQLFGGLNI